MGFLKRFFHQVSSRDESSHPGSSFDQLSQEELEAHLQVNRYGDFLLTGAVRPSFDLEIVPREGFRHDVYQDEEDNRQVPVVMAAVSKERLFELFLDLLDPLGETVDVVLETSHHRQGDGHQDLYREQMDLPVLKSILWDYEDLLLNDGCTGLAVLNPRIPREVQFDEHKLLIMYSDDLKPFERLLRANRLPCQENLKFLTEAEHIHSSSDHYFDQFEELKLRLGMDGSRDYGEPEALY